MRKTYCGIMYHLQFNSMLEATTSSAFIPIEWRLHKLVTSVAAVYIGDRHWLIGGKILEKFPYSLSR